MQLDKVDVRNDHAGDGLASPMSPPHLFHLPVCFKNLVHSVYLSVFGTVPSSLCTPPWKHPRSPCFHSFPQLWTYSTPKWGSVHLPRGGSRTPWALRTLGQALGHRPPRVHPARESPLWESWEPGGKFCSPTVTPSTALPGREAADCQDHDWGFLGPCGLSSAKSKSPRLWNLFPPALPPRCMGARPPILFLTQPPFNFSSPPPQSPLIN